MDFSDILVSVLVLINLVVLGLHIYWHTNDGLNEIVLVKKGTAAYEFSLAMEAHGNAQSEEDMDSSFFHAAKLYDELKPSERRKLPFETRAYMVSYGLAIMHKGEESDVVFTSDFGNTDED